MQQSEGQAPHHAEGRCPFFWLKKDQALSHRPALCPWCGAQCWGRAGDKATVTPLPSPHSRRSQSSKPSMVSAKGPQQWICSGHKDGSDDEQRPELDLSLPVAKPSLEVPEARLWILFTITTFSPTWIYNVVDNTCMQINCNNSTTVHFYCLRVLSPSTKAPSNTHTDKTSEMASCWRAPSTLPLWCAAAADRPLGHCAHLESILKNNILSADLRQSEAAKRFFSLLLQAHLNVYQHTLYLTQSPLDHAAALGARPCAPLGMLALFCPSARLGGFLAGLLKETPV